MTKLGLFGKSKEDTSQDQQLANVWKWIQHLDQRLKQSEKNQAILIKNNSYFISRDKQFTDSLNALVAKDKLHDQKDSEHDALIKGLQDLGKAVAAPEEDNIES